MAIEYLTPDEDEVAKLLLHLKAVIFTRELKSKVVFEWGRTATRTNPRLKVRDNACVASQPTTAPPPGVQPEANSPATPLSFSSESDSNVRSNQLHQGHRHHSKKRKREETFTELTQQQLRLKIEIPKVSSYYQKLRDLNSLLRAKKHELISAAAKIIIIKADSGPIQHYLSSDGRLIEINLNLLPGDPPDPTSESGRKEREGEGNQTVPAEEENGDMEAFQPPDQISELERKERDGSKMKMSELERKERDRSIMKAKEARRRRIEKRYQNYKAAQNRK